MVSQSGLGARLRSSALPLDGARRGPHEEHRGIRGLPPGRIRPFAKSVNRVTNVADLTPPSRLTGEEPKKSRQEAVGSLDDGTVHGARDDEHLRARDALMDQARHRGRRAGVLLADDDQRRTADSADALRQVHEADGSDGGSIAARVGFAQHGGDALHHLGMFRAKRLREPDRHGAVDQRRGHTFALGHADAVFPHGAHAGAVAGRRVAEREALDPPRLPERRRHADEPAHGDAHEVRLPDAERIQEIEEIARHLLEGIRSRRDIGAAVSAHVVAQDTESLREGRHVVVPERERDAQEMGQGDDGRLTRPVEAVVGFHKAIAMGPSPSPCPLPNKKRGKINRYHLKRGMTSRAKSSMERLTLSWERPPKFIQHITCPTPSSRISAMWRATVSGDPKARVSATSPSHVTLERRSAMARKPGCRDGCASSMRSGTTNLRKDSWYQSSASLASASAPASVSAT